MTDQSPVTLARRRHFLTCSEGPTTGDRQPRAAARSACQNMEQWLSVQGYLLLAGVAAVLVLLLSRSSKGTMGGGILSCMPQLLPSGSRGARAACCSILGNWLNRNAHHCELPPIVQETGENDVEMTVIWLHPLAHENLCSDWSCPSWSPLEKCPCEPERPEMVLRQLLPRARFVSPSADANAISADDLTPLRGIPLRSWFDLYGTTPACAYDERGIELAVERVNQLIETEIERGTPKSRIVLAGSSQGGALALVAALCCGRHQVAGVLTYASFVPLTRMVHHRDGVGLVPPPLSEVNANTPLLLMHGTEDSLIPPVYSELTASTLRQLGMDVTLYGNSTYALEGWDHANNPFKPKDRNQPTAAGRLRAERTGVSADGVSDAAHYAAKWLNEAVRKSVATAADAEMGRSGDLPLPEWRDGVSLTAGLIAQGRPAVDRLYDKDVEASLSVFTLSAQRIDVLGSLSDVRWKLPTPRARWDHDTADANRAALATNLFTAIALHDLTTIQYLLKFEKLPIDGDVLRTDRGRTPLHAAVLAESPHVTGLLITHGANPNLADDDGNTPLTLCLLPDGVLVAMGDLPVPRLNEKRRRATFALPLVVVGGAEMTEREWSLAEKHYSFLVPHIRHYLSLDEKGRELLKGLMALNSTGERGKRDSTKNAGGKTWPGGRRSFGMMRPTRFVNIFYLLFGGGVLFGCAVAEGYRDRWEELPFHPLGIGLLATFALSIQNLNKPTRRDVVGSRLMLCNVLICMGLHFWLRLSDPGYVPLPEGATTPGGDHPAAPQESDVVAAALAQGRTYCSLCRVSQPLRTYHCKDCGRCVSMRDHHCDWLDNCIGERNAGAFAAFLMLFISTGWMGVIDISKAFMVGAEEIQEKSGMVVFCVLWAFLLAGIAASCAFTGTFVTTLQFWSNGFTQNELTRRDQAMKVLYLRPPKPRSHPYDKGQCWANICSIACSSLTGGQP